MSALLQVALPEIAGDVLAGLNAQPKRLPPRLFYDSRGSALFEEITRLPEYYLTRCETEILRQHAADIARLAGMNPSVVELGAGTGQKTLLLLDALAKHGARVRYMPVDVSSSALQQAQRQIEARSPKVEVLPQLTDLNGLHFLAQAAPPRMVMYIGSSIGNLEPEDAAILLRRLRRKLVAGDSLLLGTDLVKSPRVLLPAYADSAGVTAEFNKNVLARINRELGGQFKLANFVHVARWNPRCLRMEMYLKSLCNQSVRVEALDAEFSFCRGELLHTENSYKYRIAGVRKMLARAGFGAIRTWMDGKKYFALHLARVV